MYHDLWMASCIVLALGLLCTVAGAILKYLSQRDTVYEGHAEARVVDIVTQRRTGEASLSEFRNCQVAVFEFFAGGKPVKVRDTTYAYPCPYTMNQRIRICYNPEQPQEYEIEGSDRWKRLGGIMSMLGIAGVLAGCIIFLMYAARIEL